MDRFEKEIFVRHIEAAGLMYVSQDTLEEEMRAHPNVVTSQVRLPDIHMENEFWEQMKNSVANEAASGK